MNQAEPEAKVVHREGKAIAKQTRAYMAQRAGRRWRRDLAALSTSDAPADVKRYNAILREVKAELGHLGHSTVQTDVLDEVYKQGVARRRDRGVRT